MKDFSRYIVYLKIGAAVAIVVAVALFVWWLVRGVKSSSLSFESDDRIDLTSQQVDAIKAIGEWEFLSVSDEVLIDTVRKGIFSDDHLARIYYGTLRLGIDMSQIRADKIVAHGDSVSITLLPIRLLDRDFIDEAMTRSFYESGKWTSSDREAMRERARVKMINNALTNSNLVSARANCERQITALMQSFGFKHVDIKYEATIGENKK